MTTARKNAESAAAAPSTPPTWDDPVARAGSELLGGPAGRRMGAVAGRWWNPLRVIVLAAVGLFALGMVQKLPCYDSGWFFGANDQYTHACYSDIPHLFYARGFADDVVPYFGHIPDKVSGGMPYLEYPVLTGLFMEIASWFTPHGADLIRREQIYWLVNSGMLLVCAVVTVVAVARTHRRRPWDGLLVALAPAAALTATVNWDLLALALTAVGMLLWARRRPVASGVLIGLATAAKLYPALLLGPLLLLCLRAGRMRAFTKALAGAVVAWLVVNVPVMLAHDATGFHIRPGWAQFYSYSQTRPVDFGSLWLLISQQTGNPLPDANTYAIVLMLLLCAGLAWLVLYAPRRPRFAQTAFLVVAAFVLTNKVYSPQYVLWLVPLAALARPRWRDFLVWQAGEVMYFLGIWMYLAFTTGGNNKGLPEGGYDLAIALHLLATGYLCACVVRDILRAEHDPVRQDGSDDPSGGVLDGAPDVFVLGTAGARHAARSSGTAVRWGTPPDQAA
ncbi:MULTISPECIES: glycosyltransferase family 87 protein [Streptomycetaceae]|uniref:glycosyltransferase family 87 protein n=1 Tax=Streptomycetaceae TaxID=2062 RepID=UPI000213DEF7|nr:MULTISPECIES: glycosyltransferase 87 family protein [Streptomycetaceae]CCB75845.1 Integral membrane protein [Streptantibioticus cattleyicolor NRRL 8057 = DSM 46488]